MTCSTSMYTLTKKIPAKHTHSLQVPLSWVVFVTNTTHELFALIVPCSSKVNKQVDIHHIWVCLSASRVCDSTRFDILRLRVLFVRHAYLAPHKRYFTLGIGPLSFPCVHTHTNTSHTRISYHNTIHKQREREITVAF